jgi:hypothetical protein
MTNAECRLSFIVLLPRRCGQRGTWILYEGCEWGRGELAHLGFLSPLVDTGVVCVHFEAAIVGWAGVFVCGQLFVLRCHLAVGDVAPQFCMKDVSGGAHLGSRRL